jgi:hypothetical protein
VRKEREESVWFPLGSIARTSQSYAVRGSRSPFGSAIVVTVGGRYMLRPNVPIMFRGGGASCSTISW